MKSETDWRKTDAMTADEADRLADEEDGLLAGRLGKDDHPRLAGAKDGCAHPS